MSELETRVAQLETLLKESMQRILQAEEHILQLEIKTYKPEMSLTSMQDHEWEVKRRIKVGRPIEEENEEEFYN